MTVIKRIQLPACPFKVRLLLCLTGALLCASANAQTAPSAAPAEIPAVTVASPRQEDIRQFLKLPGSLIADEQVPLFAKVSGYLEEITVDQGDTVAKGQVIARLSVPEMQPELALAEAKVRAAESRIGKARAVATLEKSNYDRLQKLHLQEPGAVTEEDVETAAAKENIGRAEVVAAEADRGVALAEVDRLKTMMAYLAVSSPLDGKVTERFVDRGAFIPAGSAAKPIVEVMATGRLRLAFDLPEKVAALVKIGHPLRYSLSSLPGKLFEGTITRQVPALNTETRTLRSEVDIEAPEAGLAPGMYASVQIPLSGLEGLSLVPATAVRTVDGKVVVLAVQDGAIAVLPVEAIIDDGTDVVVLGVLSPETRLVTKGPATLQAGQKVKIAEGA